MPFCWPRHRASFSRRSLRKTRDGVCAVPDQRAVFRRRRQRALRSFGQANDRFGRCAGAGGRAQDRRHAGEIPPALCAERQDMEAPRHQCRCQEALRGALGRPIAAILAFALGERDPSPERDWADSTNALSHKGRGRIDWQRACGLLGLLFTPAAHTAAIIAMTLLTISGSRSALWGLTSWFTSANRRCTAASWAATFCRAAENCMRCWKSRGQAPRVLP